MLVIFSIFTLVSSVVGLGLVEVASESFSADDVPHWAPDCKSGLGKIPLPIPNPENCRSLFVCSRGTLKEFVCPGGTVFSPERQKCVKGDCKKGECSNILLFRQ